MFHVGFSCGASAPKNSVLHLTVSLLVAFSVVITCRLLAGDSFSCHDPESKVPQRHLDMSCYSASVYFEQRLDDPEQDNAVGSKRYATHYAWVNLLLLAQAFVFSVPHLLWKNLEKGYLRKMPFLSHGSSTVDSEMNTESRMQLIAGNLQPMMMSHRNYVICNNLMHLANLIVCIVQAVCLFRFFQIDEITKIPAIGSDSMSRFSELYFPPSGLCDVRFHGDSGDTSAKCLLPLNQLYMYIFLFLRGWYALLVLLCSLNVLIIVLMRFSRRLRLLALSPGLPLHVLKPICNQLSYHDWFIMKKLSGNLSDPEFKKLADILSPRRNNDLLRKKTIPPEYVLDTLEEEDSTV